MATAPQKGDASRENIALKGRLTALSAVLKLGHEAFTKADLRQWIDHVVNNSVLAVDYRRSALIDLRGNRPRVVAISGAPEVNANSEYVQDLLRLIRGFARVDKITELDEEMLENLPGGDEASVALKSISPNGTGVVVVPLHVPGESGRREHQNQFLWVVELEGDEQQISLSNTILSLLREHYDESLFFILVNRRGLKLNKVMTRRNIFRPSRLFFLLLIAFAIASFTVRIHQTVSGEFEIVPQKAAVIYAPFEAVVAKAGKRSGDAVKKGDLVLVFDTEERRFNLNAAQNEFNKTSAQLDLVQRQAFRDISKRAQIRVLELQKERAAIDIARNEYYLRRSEVQADNNGILDIGDADKLEGRAVRPGEKLFEILGTGNLIAEVSLDERNASVLSGRCDITLYLHARPETPIPAKIIAISPKPTLTERKVYCYVIEVDFDEKFKPELICGMRGVARVAGDKVTLGYYLFRSLVLWYRQL